MGQQLEAPVRVSSGALSTMQIKKVSPIFPPEAKAQRVNGAVVMHVIIGRDGFVESATVVSGPELLHASYLGAVKQWVYRPFLLNGNAVRVETTVTLSMSLGGYDEPHQSEPAGPYGNGDGPKSSPLMKDRVRVSSGVMSGRIVKKGNPDYPPTTKGEYVSGAVVLHVVVGKDGKVLEATVISGPQSTRANALAAVKQWEYKPYMLEGAPVEVDTTVTLNIDFGG